MKHRRRKKTSPGRRATPHKRRATKLKPQPVDQPPRNEFYHDQEEYDPFDREEVGIGMGISGD